MREHIEIIVEAADIFWSFCRHILTDLEKEQPQWWGTLLDYDRRQPPAHQISAQLTKNHPGHQGIEIMDYQACAKTLYYVFFDWMADHYGIPSAAREKYASNLKEAIFIRNEAIGHQNSLTFESFGDERLKSRLDCYLNLMEPLKKSFPDDYIEIKNYYNRFIDNKLKINLPLSVEELSQEFMCSEKDVLHACVEKEIPVLDNSQKVGCRDYKVLLEAILPWVNARNAKEGKSRPESGPDEKRTERSEIPVELKSLDRNSGLTLYKEQIAQIAQRYDLVVDESVPMEESGRNFLSLVLSPVLEKLGSRLLADSSTLHYLISLANMRIFEDDVGKKERLRGLKSNAKSGYECLKALREKNGLGIARSIDISKDTGANLICVLKKSGDKPICLLTQNDEFAKTCWDIHRPNLIVLKVLNDYSARVNKGTDVRASYPHRNRKPEEVKEPAFRAVSFCGRMDNTPIERPEIGEGDALQAADSGEEVLLGKAVSSGGEGTVFETNIPGMVAKIYGRNENTRGRESKIRRMVGKRPDIPGLCWPLSILQTPEGAFSGYLMYRAEGLELATSVFRPIRNGLRGFPEWNRKDLAELCITLCFSFDALHRNNILAGDVNARNILVKNSQTVFFVDADSYQVEEFPCPVGTLIYTAPEIFEEQKAQDGNLNYAGFLRTVRQEQYSMAVLLFQVLLPGKIPFTQDGGVIDRSFTFPFYRDEENAVSAEKAPSGRWRFIWSHLPYEMKDAFYGVFAEGRRYSAGEWIEKLQHYSDMIDHKQSTSELFPSTFKETPEGDGFRALICPRCGANFNIGNAKYETLRSGGITEIYCKLCMDELRMNQKIEISLTCSRCGSVYRETRQYAAELLKRGRPFLCPDCRTKGGPATERKKGTDAVYSRYPWERQTGTAPV